MPRFHFAAALAATAALLVPAAASAQAPAPNPAAQQQTASTLEAQIKQMQTEIQGRNQEIVRLNAQLKSLSPLAAAPVRARIDQLNAANQTAMFQLQALINRWNAALQMQSNAMAKMSNGLNGVIANIRP